VRTCHDHDAPNIVVPAYNEADVLPLFHARLTAVLDRMPIRGTIIYVDDGSQDATWSLLDRLAAADDRIHALRLSRNFGKEAALTAGIDAVSTPSNADVASPRKPGLPHRVGAGTARQAAALQRIASPPSALEATPAGTVLSSMGDGMPPRTTQPPQG